MELCLKLNGYNKTIQAKLSFATTNLRGSRKMKKIYELSKLEVGKLQIRLTELVNSGLSDKYILVSTPTELSILDDKDIVITIEAKKYTTVELLNVIEKAAKYDGLSK